MPFIVVAESRLGDTDAELQRAKQLLEVVVVRLTEILGSEHPQTSTARCTYALALERGGDVCGAVALLTRSLEELTASLGEHHARTEFVRCALNGLRRYEVSAAAVVIQAAFRGYITRKMLREGVVPTCVRHPSNGNVCVRDPGDGGGCASSDGVAPRRLARRAPRPSSGLWRRLQSATLRRDGRDGLDLTSS